MTRRSTRTSRRGRGAFTLVEVLVASVVAVAVAGAAAAVLWQGMRANAAVASNRAAEDGLARLALAEALRADVASAAPLPKRFFSMYSFAASTLFLNSAP